MTRPLQPVFAQLRGLLQAHESSFDVADDDGERYRLKAPVGSATIQAWGGKTKAATIPIAWVEVRKTYVSYHLMGIDGNPKIAMKLSQQLRRHMQGKTCFNFKTLDAGLIEELRTVTAESLLGLRKAGFIADRSVGG